jgi:hypothetical protein
MVEQGCMSTYQLQMANGKMWCPIAHDYFEPKNMAPAYTVLAGITSEIMDYMFGLGQASLYNRAANCLFINAMAKTSFGKGDFVIVPIPN